jgi:hypothetical protein
MRIPGHTVGAGYIATFQGKRISLKELALNRQNERGLLDEARLMTGVHCASIVGFHSAYAVENAEREQSGLSS